MSVHALVGGQSSRTKGPARATAKSLLNYQPRLLALFVWGMVYYAMPCVVLANAAASHEMANITAFRVGFFTEIINVLPLPSDITFIINEFATL